MIGLPGSIQGNLRDRANNFVWDLVGSGVPVDGTSGTAVGLAGPGSTYIDVATGFSYANIGTISSPIWSNTADAVSALGGLGITRNAKMTYSFAVDAGAISTITPSNSPTIPLNAIILGGVIDITTTLTSGGAATIALGLGSGGQVAALKAATAVASWTAGLTLPIIPVFTAATYYKVTAAARLTMTIAAATLTAGRFDVSVVYVIGNT
jgi:hypothetical protein